MLPLSLSRSALLSLSLSCTGPYRESITDWQMHWNTASHAHSPLFPTEIFSMKISKVSQQINRHHDNYGTQNGRIKMDPKEINYCPSYNIMSTYFYCWRSSHISSILAGFHKTDQFAMNPLRDVHGEIFCLHMKFHIVQIPILKWPDFTHENLSSNGKCNCTSSHCGSNMLKNKYTG